MPQPYAEVYRCFLCCASLEHHLAGPITFFASCTLLWADSAGQVAQMYKNRLPKRPMLAWVLAPRVAGGQEMAFGRRYNATSTTSTSRRW